MRVKRYVAASAEAAVAQVRAELGPEAIILHTQPVRSKSLLGLLTRPRIEVVAAVDPNLAAGALAPPRSATALAAPPVVAAPVAAPPAAPAVELGRMQQDVGQLATLMGRLASRLDLPETVQRLGPELRQVFAALQERGVRDDLALAVAQRVRRHLQRGGRVPEQALEIAATILARDLGAAQPCAVRRGQRRVAALIGPTGVGKTTTLAKLAAQHALARGLSVALITADTYRIAAVEQLRTYAEIIGVPLQVVASPEELPEAMARCAGADLVLVDTAGRSHKSAAQMAEARAILERLHPDETYLVLALTASDRDLLAAAEAYASLGFDRYILTKFDEASAPGSCYNLVRTTRRPLSYVTSGQNVPDDIEVASPSKLGRLLLGV